MATRFGDAQDGDRLLRLQRRHSVALAVALLAAGSLVGQHLIRPARGADAATRPAATRPATTEPVEHVVSRAYEMITAAQYDDARKLLEPAARAAPGNARVNLGLGYALLRLDRVKQALPYLDKAYAGQPTDRTLVLTLASALQDENPMRGARILKDYMSNSSRPPDEELQNALGCTLNHAARSATVNKETFYEECRSFYMQYDLRLSESHGGGQRHWGTQWIDSKDAQSKWDTVVSREKNLKAASRNAELSSKATAKAKDHLEGLYNGFGLHSTAEYRQGKTDFDAAVANEKAAHTQLHKADAAMAKAEQPPFEKSIPTPPFWQKE